MENKSWIISTKRMIIGLVVAIVFCLSGLCIELLLGIDIGLLKYLGVGVGVIAFCFIALKAPKKD